MEMRSSSGKDKESSFHLTPTEIVFHPSGRSSQQSGILSDSTSFSLHDLQATVQFPCLFLPRLTSPSRPKPRAGPVTQSPIDHFIHLSTISTTAIPSLLQAHLPNLESDTFTQAAHAYSAAYRKLQPHVLNRRVPKSSPSALGRQLTQAELWDRLDVHRRRYVAEIVKTGQDVVRLLHLADSVIRDSEQKKIAKAVSRMMGLGLGGGEVPERAYDVELVLKVIAALILGFYQSVADGYTASPDAADRIRAWTNTRALPSRSPKPSSELAQIVPTGGIPSWSWSAIGAHVENAGLVERPHAGGTEGAPSDRGPFEKLWQHLVSIADVAVTLGRLERVVTEADLEVLHEVLISGPGIGVGSGRAGGDEEEGGGCEAVAIALVEAGYAYCLPVRK